MTAARAMARGRGHVAVRDDQRSGRLTGFAGMRTEVDMWPKSSHTEWEGFWHLPGTSEPHVPAVRPRGSGRNGGGGELAAKVRIKIVARTLSLREVDDADRALQPAFERHEPRMVEVQGEAGRRMSCMEASCMRAS